MKKAILVLMGVLALGAVSVEAAVQLPNYAAGGGALSAEIQSKGKNVTDIISMIVAILAIIGMLVGAGYFGVGNQEKGKQYLFGGVIALVLAGTVYGIASLVA